MIPSREIFIFICLSFLFLTDVKAQLPNVGAPSDEDLVKGNNNQVKQVAMTPSNPIFSQVNGDGANVTLMTEVNSTVVKDGNSINTNPVNVTDPIHTPIFLKTPLPGSFLLSGDWVTISGVSSNCYLSVGGCVDGSNQPNCDLIIQSSNLNDSIPNTKFQVYIVNWDKENLTGLILLKDFMGRWVTTNSVTKTKKSFKSTAYVSQNFNPESFSNAATSSFHTFQIKQEKNGVQGYFQFYRPWIIDEYGNLQPFTPSDKDNSNNGGIGNCNQPWILSDLSMKSLLDLRMEPTQAPTNTQIVDEKLINTKFYLSQVEKNAAQAYVAFAQVCNAASVQEQIILVYSFTAQAIFQADTGKAKTIGGSLGLTIQAPRAQTMFMPYPATTVEASWNVQFIHGKSAGFWNLTSLGQSTYLYVPAHSRQNASVVAKYEYLVGLPWTATYQRKFADGSLFTYVINGSWSRAQYWDGRVEYSKTTSTNDCTAISVS